MIRMEPMKIQQLRLRGSQERPNSRQFQVNAVTAKRAEQRIGVALPKLEKERADYINALNAFGGSNWDVEKEKREYEQAGQELSNVSKGAMPWIPGLVRQEQAEIGSERRRMEKYANQQVSQLDLESRYATGDPMVQKYDTKAGTFYLEDTGERYTGNLASQEFYQPTEYERYYDKRKKKWKTRVKKMGTAWSFQGASYKDTPVYRSQSGEMFIGMPGVSYNQPTNTYSVTGVKLRNGQISASVPLYEKASDYSLKSYIGMTEVGFGGYKPSSRKTSDEVRGSFFSWQQRALKIPKAERVRLSSKRYSTVEQNKAKQQWTSEWNRTNKASTGITGRQAYSWASNRGVNPTTRRTNPFRW